MRCTVLQNYNILPFLYFSLVCVIRFVTNREYGFVGIFKSDCHLTIITLIGYIKIDQLLLLSFWFEVALMHIYYTAEFINRNQRIELTYRQPALLSCSAYCLNTYYNMKAISPHYNTTDQLSDKVMVIAIYISMIDK